MMKQISDISPAFEAVHCCRRPQSTQEPSTNTSDCNETIHILDLEMTQDKSNPNFNKVVIPHIKGARGWL